MFDDDKIGHQAAYEQFHRTRPTPERGLDSKITEVPQRTRGHAASPFARDRFEDLFEQSKRLW